MNAADSPRVAEPFGINSLLSFPLQYLIHKHVVQLVYHMLNLDPRMVAELSYL